MSTLTGTPVTGDTGAPASRRPLLTGVTWLVWRQHRAAYLTVLGAGVLLVAWTVFQRDRMLDFLTGYGWPANGVETLGPKFEPYAAAFQPVSTALGLIPVVLGVFVGAPLLAGDLEHGTAKLVAAQTVSRTRWLATKLGLTALVITVSTVAPSIAFGWWWEPLKQEATVLDWTSGAAFDTTGPVAAALTLFTVVGGVAIGVVLRRTLAAMVVAFGFAVAVQLAWNWLRLELGDVVTVTTDKGVLAEGSFPTLPDAAHQLDQWYLTGSGELLGWSTCVDEETEQARELCLRQADVIGWSVDYLPISQMAGMQWLGAAILLALTAAVTAFLFLWARKRLV
ncbi:ABC transporter permease subunit [Streptomyces chromofuscus]|uniref:ABC transporter permease subunit n=1 Tax=Streptomyces chromofuscus TaxID=42881 RepID=A0A7M2T3D3_STRCW|nr:ABC transporter permease subunit [Streptomyces chromofuscus]QOV42011.1 ABC transporter permease subunit [Streptomyces chromofuscus]GGS86360.1 transporter [Streptomyces chromofuscus]